MLNKLIKKGHDTLQEERAVEERKKLGFLRGGSCSSMSKEGRVIGACPRITLLRKLGLESTTPLNLSMIFHVGYSHETFIKKALEKCGEFDRITTEDSAENSFVTDIDGNSLTLRVDLIAHMKSGERFGIECKALTSNFSAEKIMQKFQVPYIKALVQASWYFHIGKFERYFIIYGNYFNSTTFFKGKMNKVNASLLIFELIKKEEDSGVIKIYLRRYNDDDTYVDVETPITLDGIERAYKYIVQCEQEQKVPVRRVEYELNGMKTYNQCDPRYCPCAKLCDDVDANLVDYDTWVKEAKELFKGEEAG